MERAQPILFPADAVAVSIPERVWGGLELEALVLKALKTGVSIPERVWGGLEQ